MPKTAQKSIEQQIISLLSAEKNGLTSKEMTGALKITKKEYHLFRKALNYLSSSHQIYKGKGKKNYRISTRSRMFQGELRMNKSGFGFVRDVENNVEIFIGRDHLNTAFDLDIVEVKLYARSRGKNEDGYVSKVIKRTREIFVGTFHETEYYGFVVPDDAKIYRDFFIPKEKKSGAKDGDKVVVSLTKWDSDHLNPEGAVTEVLGKAGDPGVDVVSVAYSFQLGIKFPPKVEQQASAIPVQITKDEIAKRLDIRKKVCFTIDPVDARDFDDAVSLEKLANGNWELGVHIADVSHYVPENSDIDNEALKRGTSVYLVDRVIPMLPEKLSNDICSLRPNEDRLTFSCIMELSASHEVLNYTITPSIIHSKKRFTYEEVQAIVDTKATNEFSGTLHAMMDLSRSMTKKRLAEGGIDFETPEISFDMDQTGFPVAIKRKDRLGSHRLVEEFMLMANKTVAGHIRKISGEKKTLPFVYRIHEKPDQDKLAKFYDFLNALGYKVNFTSKDVSGFFQQVMLDIKGSREEVIIEEVALRSMMKAIYSVTNVGHFGLGFKDYTHFTSPIRRFPDLTVHRLLKKYLTNGGAPEPQANEGNLTKICEQSTKMERTALEAERESVRMKKNEYISQHVGEEFEGIISGVMSFGIFVELLDTLVEGLVHIRDLDGYYVYDEKTYTLVSTGNGLKLRLGDSVRIKVSKVNLEAGKVDFKLVEKLS